jgi:hypothetical protein
VIGKKITRRELQARWAYNELASKRFVLEKVQFSAKESQSLFDKARANAPFESLSKDEFEQLMGMHEECCRCILKGEIFDCLKGAKYFVCQSWPKEALLETMLVSSLGGERFSDFVVRESSPGMSADPRTAAARRRPVEPFKQGEPICVVPYNHCQLLIEGALRALMFMIGTDNRAEILVWAPEGANGLTGARECCCVSD